MPELGASVSSLVDPWAVQDRIGTTDARYALSTMLMPVPNLSYIDYRSGVMASGDTEGVGGSSHMAMRIVPGDGMSVRVEMGNCVVNTPNEGPYMAALDSVKTLELQPSSTSNARIDLVIARIHDDQNAALSSPEGQRKLTVEVWTGDPSPQPQQPVPAPAAGWIPLAAIRIEPGSTTITAPVITDLRGPGLVARGGMRGLYGVDTHPDAPAYTEPGAYPGDQRWVHTSGFQHQVYYGQTGDPATSGWRGVHNALIYNVNPPPGEMLWIRGAGTLRNICSVRIPYPGTPFMIFPTGRLVVQQSPSTALDVHIKVHDALTGPVVNWVGDDSGNVNADTRHVYNVAPLMYGPFYTPIDVFLTGQIYTTSDPNFGFGYQGAGQQNLLSVVVYPSTVQPPTA